MDDEDKILAALMAGTDFIGEDDDDDDDDLVGALDLVGAVDLVGASRKGSLAKLAKLGALQKRIKNAQRRGVDTVRSEGSKARRLFFGATRAGIVTAVAQVIEIKAQEDFRVDRLIISATDANGVVAPSSLLISDIRVGTRSQFSSIGAITADLFQRDFFSNGSDLGLDTIQAGTDLSIAISATLATAQNPTSITVSAQGRALR
jgi:hypothetical protein